MSIRSKEAPMTPQRTDKHTGSRKVACSCEVCGHMIPSPYDMRCMCHMCKDRRNKFPEKLGKV